MSQLVLTFLPSWWTDDDSRICRAYHEQEAREDMPVHGAPETLEESELLAGWCDSLHPLQESYTCRRCAHWASRDGSSGRCLHVDVARPTAGNSMCEEWHPLTGSEVAK